MQTYIAMLRGINVGGHNKIKMADLRASLESFGLESVQTYIQSGNIVFKSSELNESSLEKVIHDTIQETFGFDIQVMVRAYPNFKTIAEKHPFIDREEADHKKLHITFLGEKVEPMEAEEKIRIQSGRDELSVSDSAIYLFCPDGYGRTKYSHAHFESKLKVACTTRNWRTVCKLQEMAEDILA